MKIKTLKAFNELNAKEIRELDYKSLAKGLGYYRNDLNYDLRKPLAPQSKGKLNRIREQYIGMMSINNGVVYSPRSKKRRKAAADFVGVKDNWKRLKIEKNKDEKIIFKNGKLKLKGKYTERGRTQFNYQDLITDPYTEVLDILKENSFESAHIQTGEHLLGGIKKNGVIDFGDDKEKEKVATKITREINILLNTYNDTEKWLNGLELIEFANQQTKDEFKKSRSNPKLRKKVRHAKKTNRRS